VDPDGPLQMQVSALDYNSYVGVIGVGRITRGTADAEHAGGRGRRDGA
jgi:GTP-binding protein